MSNNDWKPDPEPRRRGYREYDPSCGSHHDKNPYNYTTWQWRSYKKGWESAHHRAVNAEKEAEEKEWRMEQRRAEWQGIKCSCPWWDPSGNDRCRGSGDFCRKASCAPYYFSELKG